jgi:hypothetical protein
MAKTPTGTTFFLFTSLGSAVAITGISNAVEAVVTAPAHGFSAGDPLLIKSAWGRLNKRCFRIKAGSVTTDNFTLERCNTTNTEFYPPGAGVGTAQEAQTPVQLTEVLAATSQGGEAKTVNYKYMESDVDFQLNDGFNPVSQQFEFDADSFDGAGYNLMETLTETGIDTVLKKVLKGGSFTLSPGNFALNSEVILQDGQVNRVRGSFAQTNRSVRY